MIISTAISVICFIAVIIELWSIYRTLRTCVTIKCEVVSSKKIQERTNGFLTGEYWETVIGFTNGSSAKKTVLRTSTYCQKGQRMTCYYYPKEDIVFRKRDLRKLIHSSSMIVTSVGILFLLLNFLFHVSSIGVIFFKNAAAILTVLLSLFFLSLGAYYVSYALIAFKNTSSKKTTKVEALIYDVIRKTKKHQENQLFFYYSIYRYTFNGVEHETKSKIKRSSPPIVGSYETILIDKKKCGPVEYDDPVNTLLMGVCFLFIFTLLIYIFWFKY